MKRRFGFLFIIVMLFAMMLSLVSCKNVDTPDEDDQEEDEEEIIVEKEKYTVKFDTDGGSSVDNATVEEGSTVKKPATDPTKEGYTFAYWALNDEEYDFSNEVKYNITLVAKYNINTYSLTIKKNNGEDNEVIQYKYNEIIQTISKPSKEHYTFSGWNMELPERMPNSDLTIEAEWIINKYTLTIKFNDNRTANLILTQDYGTPIQEITIPTWAGHTFDKWSEEIPETMPAENKTIEGIWKAQVNTLTIKDYNADGTDFIITQEYNSVLNIDEPTRKGYIFTGYTSGANGTGFDVILDTMFINDMTIYANWELAIVNISYNLDGGSLTEDLPSTFNIDTPDYDLPSPTKENYYFDGWYTDSSFINSITKITKDIDKDTTIYAKWNMIILRPSANEDEFVYNQEAQKPTFALLDENQVEISGNYNYIYNVGEYTTVFTPSDGYCWTDGTKTPYEVNWKIVKATLEVEWTNTTVIYNGTEQNPIYMVNSSFVRLTLVQKYQNVGTYTVQLNYQFVNELASENYEITNTSTSFTILPASITSVSVDQVTFAFTGEQLQPNVIGVKSNLIDLASTEYDVEYETSVIAGQYKVSVTAKGNFTGKIETSYEIKKTGSDFGLTYNKINTHPGDVIDISQYVIKNYGTLAYSIVSSNNIPSNPTINDSSITIPVLSVDNDNNGEIVIEVSDSGDSGHVSKTEQLTIKVEKYETTISNIVNLNVNLYDTYDYCDLAQYISTNANATLGNYTVSTNDTDYISLLTNCMKFIYTTNYCSFTINVASTATAKATSQIVYVNINPIKVINQVSINGLTINQFKYNTTATIDVLSNVSNINYAYKWYYLESQTEHVLSSASSYTCDDINLIGKEIKVLVTPILDSCLYTDTIAPISLGTVPAIQVIRATLIDGLNDENKLELNKTLSVFTIKYYSEIDITYKWYYLDANQEEHVVGNTDSYTCTDYNLIGKEIYVLIKPDLDESKYSDTINPICDWGAIVAPEVIDETSNVLWLANCTGYKTAYLSLTGKTITGVLGSTNDFSSRLSGNRIVLDLNILTRTEGSTYDVSVYAVASGTVYEVKYKVFIIPAANLLQIGEINSIAINGYECAIQTLTSTSYTGDVYIPTHYCGLKVQQLNYQSFMEQQILTASKLYVPWTVTSIANGTFYNTYSEDGINGGNYTYSIYFDISGSEFDSRFTNVASWGGAPAAEDEWSTFNQLIYVKDNGSYVQYSSFTNYYYSIVCVVEGTKVTLADGTKKNVEDVTYNDLLLVKDLINGGYTYEYPGWIEKSHRVNSYTLITFDDNTQLKICGAQSLFDVDLMKFVDNGSLLEVGHRVLKVVLDANGNPTNVFVTIKSIETINEQVNVYHVFSAAMYNCLTDDVMTTFLGETLLDNYTYDSDFTFNKAERSALMTEENLYSYEELKATMPYHMYLTYRANESKISEIKGIFTHEQWIQYLTQYANNPYMVVDPFKDEDGNNLWAVSTDNDISEQTIVTEGSTYTLGECTITNNGKVFKGWRDNVTNIIYNAGDTVTIYCATHFSAVWE